MPQLTDSKTTNTTTDVQHLSKSYYASFFTNLNNLRHDERFCDVELMAGGEHTPVIKAHRIVLSSSSSYFEAMFGNDVYNENKEKVVKMHSIDHKILKTLVDFIYTGKIEIDQVNVQELLAAADMLQLPDVVTGCAQYLCRELHPSNTLGVSLCNQLNHHQALKSILISDSAIC